MLPIAKSPRVVEAVNAKSRVNAKKGGGQLQTESLIMVVTCKMCLFSLYFVIYMIFIVWKALKNNLDLFCC